MTETDKNQRQDPRKARLAAELRRNLAQRKAQSRARRTGEADTRPEGLASAAGPGDEGTEDGGTDRAGGGETD
jgi:hypothetical protein